MTFESGFTVVKWMIRSIQWSLLVLFIGFPLFVSWFIYSWSTWTGNAG